MQTRVEWEEVPWRIPCSHRVTSLMMPNHVAGIKNLTEDIRHGARVVQLPGGGRSLCPGGQLAISGAGILTTADECGFPTLHTNTL